MSALSKRTKGEAMLTNCPNCDAVVTDRTIDCPGCRGPLRQRPPDVSGRIFVWTFFAFNAFMGLWTIFYAITGRVTLRTPQLSNSDTSATDLPLGGEMGLGFLLGLWVFGALVLGLCAAFVFVQRAGRSIREHELGK